MDNNTLTTLFYGQAVCSLLIISSFAAWFLLRENRLGDQACTLIAILCAVALFISLWAAGRYRSFGLVTCGPGLLAFGWFMGLKGSRNRQSRIRRWSRQHGYRLMTVETQWTANPRTGSLRSKAETRVTAQRKSDGQYLIGWVFDDGLNFDVVWDPLPTRHGGPGRRGPILPHAEPPGPSKE